HAFGVSPRYEDIHWDGLNFSTEQYQTVTHIDNAAWTQELALHSELFTQLAHHLPRELEETKAKIEKRLAA
ncbi:phosphoenolpyruvate carboxykinase domain-containing protein, partial [Hydrogenophaga sp.]